MERSGSAQRFGRFRQNTRGVGRRPAQRDRRLARMRLRLLAICTLVALATFAAGSAQAAQPQQQVSGAARTLLNAINSARAAAGVPPLRASASLTNAATWQSQALAGAGYLDHTSPDGSTLIDRLTPRALERHERGRGPRGRLPALRGRGDVAGQRRPSREPALALLPHRRIGSRARHLERSRCSLCHRRFRRLNERRGKSSPVWGGFGPSRNDALGPITPCA